MSNNKNIKVQTAIWGDKTQHGIAPSIALINPKTAANVGMIIRLASCYGFKQVWWSGERVSLDIERRGRIPREERMKGYRDVQMIQHDRFFDQFPADATPVAIEVRENSENLLEFEHPENAVYVFGPEDGSIPRATLQLCHRFVVIPTRHCLNLATAVATVIYDRQIKAYLNGNLEVTTPGEFEERGVRESTEELLGSLHSK